MPLVCAILRLSPEINWHFFLFLSKISIAQF
jgi:hypothetical protein